jgi:hypothetical protein
MQNVFVSKQIYQNMIQLTRQCMISQKHLNILVRSGNLKFRHQQSEVRTPNGLNMNQKQYLLAKLF